MASESKAPRRSSRLAAGTDPVARAKAAKAADESTNRAIADFHVAKKEQASARREKLRVHVEAEKEEAKDTEEGFASIEEMIRLGNYRWELVRNIGGDRGSLESVRLDDAFSAANPLVQVMYIPTDTIGAHVTRDHSVILQLPDDTFPLVHGLIEGYDRPVLFYPRPNVEGAMFVFGRF